MYIVGVECPAGREFDACREEPSTCLEVGESDATSGCYEGCYCPDNMLLQDGKQTKLMQLPPVWCLKNAVFIACMFGIR